MKSPDKNIFEKAFRKIESLMREKSVNKLMIERKYLLEIFNPDVLEIYEGLPILRPLVELYFKQNGISIKFFKNIVEFKRMLSKEIATGALDDALKRLLANMPEVKAAAIVSTEGLPIVSALPQGVDETRLSALMAAFLSLAENSISEIKNGEFDELYIKGTDGYLLIMQAGPNAVLALSTKKKMRVKPFFLD